MHCSMLKVSFETNLLLWLAQKESVFTKISFKSDLKIMKIHHKLINFNRKI